MTHRRPLFLSIAVACAATIAAFAAAVAVDRLLGGNDIAASAVLALVVAALFASWPAIGLSSFAVVVLFSDTVEWWSGADLSFVDEIGILLLGLTLFTAQRGRLAWIRPGIREGFLALVFGVAILSSLVSGIPADVWVPGLGLMAKGFAFFYLTGALRITLDEVHAILGTLFGVAVVVVSIGAFEFVLGQAVRDALQLPPYDRVRAGMPVVTSVFLHPALYGWLCVFFGVGLIARFAVLGEKWALVMGALFSGASVLSGRRTPILGLVAGVTALIARQLASRHSNRRTVGLIAAVFVLLAVLALPVVGRLYTETVNEYLEPRALIAEILSENPDPDVLMDMAPRNALYLGSVAIARDHFPLGAGLGRFGSHASRMQYSPVYAEYGLNRIWGLSEKYPIAITDTFWPMILGETGVVGLAAMFAFLASVLRDLWRVAGQPMPAAARAFALGALLAFVEALTRSLTSGVFVAPPVAYFVFGAAGLAVAVGRELSVRTETNPSVSTVTEAPPP